MNEFAQFTQGHGDVKGMDVIAFMPKSSILAGKQATHARCVVDCCPEKDEPWQIRITCSGDEPEHSGETATHSASVETIKCQLNSIMSMHGAKGAVGDISDMCLNSDLPDEECV